MKNIYFYTSDIFDYDFNYMKEDYIDCNFYQKEFNSFDNEITRDYELLEFKNSINDDTIYDYIRNCSNEFFDDFLLNVKNFDLSDYKIVMIDSRFFIKGFFDSIEDIIYYDRYAYDIKFFYDPSDKQIYVSYGQCGISPRYILRLVKEDNNIDFSKYEKDKSKILKHTKPIRKYFFGEGK